MQAFLQKLWAEEPVVVAIVGNGAFWAALFGVAAAFGHPVPDPQRDALVGLGTCVAAIVARSQVSPTK